MDILAKEYHTERKKEGKDKKGEDIKLCKLTSYTANEDVKKSILTTLKYFIFSGTGTKKSNPECNAILVMKKDGSKTYNSCTTEEEKEAYISVDQHYKNIVEFYKQQNFNVEDIAVKDKILTWHKVLTINHCFEILKFISVYKKRPKRDDLVLLINGKRILTQQEFGKLSAGDRKCTQQIVKFATTFYSIEQTNP